MKIKRIKKLYYVLMYLPLIITLIALMFLPEQVPAHYGIDNQVTRWGSKYEMLLFPFFNICMGFFILIVTKNAARQEGEGNNNAKVGMVTGIMTLVLFNVMTYYFLYAALNKVENLSDVAFDIYQIVFCITGIIMIIIGNIMPKVRMNSIMGLRTPWSLKNEVTWKMSQRFGGFTFIMAGVVIIVISFVLSGLTCFMYTMIVLVILLCVDVLYTYKVSKKIR